MDDGERLGRRELQTRAVSGAMWTVLHVMVSLPIAFAVNIVLARILGVVDYGRLAYLTMVMQIAGLVVIAGVGNGLIQFGSKAHSVGDAQGVRSLLRRTQGFRILVGAPILTLAVLILVDVPPLLLALAIIFGIWVPAGFGGATAALTIQNDTARAARLAIVMNLVGQAVVVTTLLTLPSPDVVWSARMVVMGASIIAAIFLVQRRYRRAVLTPRWPSGMPSGFWRYALPIGLSGVVSTLALSRSEVVILEHLSTAEQVGLYAMAFGLAGHLFAPAQALITPLTPAISALREVDEPAIRPAFLRMSRMSNLLASSVIAVGGPVLALLVPLLYGEAFRAARGLVFALVIVSGLLVLTYPMQTFVSARLRSASTLGVNVLSLAASVTIALLLIPWVGAWGAVWGKFGVAVTRVIWLGLRETESFMVSGREFLSSFRVTAVCSAGALVVYFAGLSLGAVSESSVMGAAAAFLLGSLLVISTVRISRGGLEAGDVEAMERVVPEALRPWVRRATWIVRSAVHVR